MTKTFILSFVPCYSDDIIDLKIYVNYPDNVSKILQLNLKAIKKNSFSLETKELDGSKKWTDCQKECESKSGCTHWTFEDRRNDDDKKPCILYQGFTSYNLGNDDKVTSGAVFCIKQGKFL